MAVDVTVISNLTELGLRIEAAAGELKGLRPLAIAANVIAEHAQQIIEDHTPKVTGDLAGSTDHQTTISGLGARIDIAQPQEAPDGFPYVWAVVKGRKAITAPSDGPWSTGALALNTPWGPRKSVKASKPNPYPTEAEPELQEAAGAALFQAGMEDLKVAVATMKG